MNEISNYDSGKDLSGYKYPPFFCDYLNQRPANLSLPLLWSYNKDTATFKDLTELKNIIIAGTQATGKTNFLHQLILSLLSVKHPSQLKFVFVDIKGLELRIYRSIENHFLAKLAGEENPILKDFNKATNGLNALCIEMDNRYELMLDANVRNIQEYNSKFVAGQLNSQKGHQYLPSIILIIDDLGGFTYQGSQDLIMPLVRLANEGYKAGIYNIISTSQTNNTALPNSFLSMISERVVFRLNSKEEYRKFFDTTRFEIPSQVGNFLYYDSGKVYSSKTFLIEISDIDKVVNYIATQPNYPQAFLLPEYFTEKELQGKEFDISKRDSLFEDAAKANRPEPDRFNGIAAAQDEIKGITERDV